MRDPAMGQALRPRAVAMLMLLVAINGVNLVDRNMFGLLLPAIKQDIALSDAALGLLGGPAFALTYALSAIPIAMLADRTSRRNLIATGVALWSVAVAATAAAAGAMQLFVLRMVLGVGQATNMAPCSSLIADLFPGQRRTLAVSVYAAGAPLGIMLGFPFIGWLAQTHGWRGTFVVMGAVGLILAVLLVAIGREPMREHQRAGAAKHEVVPFFAGLRQLWGNRAFVTLVLAGVLFSITNTVMNVWAPTFLNRVHHLDIKETGAFLGLYKGLFGIFASILGGWLVSRLSNADQRWVAWVPAILCFAMGPAELLFLWSGGSIGWQVGMVLDTLMVSAVTPCTFSLLLMVVDSRIRAFGAAVYLLIFALVGQSVGSYLVGLLSDALAAEYQEQAIRIAMTISPIAIMLCGLALLALSRRLSPPATA